MAKIVTRRRGLWEQLYVPEIVRGLSVTLRHFFVNFFARKETVTVDYPEEKRELPERYRGRHRLMKREDGTVRCTACMMCATICPANCIHIVAGERLSADNRSIEKYPVKFEIDELVCVVCGLCVEACPCDAVRMDSQEHVLPVTDRGDAWFSKEELMSRGGPSIAKDGGADPRRWREEYAPLGDVTAIYMPEKRQLGGRDDS